jgi:hypothetical protein
MGESAQSPREQQVTLGLDEVMPSPSGFRRYSEATQGAALNPPNRFYLLVSRWMRETPRPCPPGQGVCRLPPWEEGPYGAAGPCSVQPGAALCTHESVTSWASYPSGRGAGSASGRGAGSGIWGPWWAEGDPSIPGSPRSGVLRGSVVPRLSALLRFPSSLRDHAFEPSLASTIERTRKRRLCGPFLCSDQRARWESGHSRLERQRIERMSRSSGDPVGTGSSTSLGRRPPVSRGSGSPARDGSCSNATGR